MQISLEIAFPGGGGWDEFEAWAELCKSFVKDRGGGPMYNEVLAHSASLHLVIHQPEGCLLIQKVNLAGLN